MKTRFFHCPTTFSILLWILMQTALGQTYLCTNVPAASPDPTVQLFQFNTPDNAAAGDTWMIAKFVVDNTATDLQFRLEPTTIAKFPVTDFKISDGNVPLLDPGVSSPDNVVATLRVRDLSATEPTSNPGTYRIIRISIDYDDDYPFPATEVWRLRAHKPAAAGTAFHFWGFWNQGAGGESTVNSSVTQPKLIQVQADLTACGSFSNFTSPTNISFGDVHINLAATYIPDEQYEFINVGTKPLNITAANPVSMPASAYNIENYPSPPFSVGAMGTFSRRVTCQPTSVGDVPNVNITLTTDSIGDLALNLTGSRGIRLSSAILFDLSGSMLTDKNDNFPVPEEQQKVALARLAALELVELYGDILPKARLALFSYPNTAGTCPSSQQLIALNEIENNKQSFKNHLDAGLANASLIRPDQSFPLTPMAEGIKAVYEALPKNQPNQRAATFQFGDGEHNCNSSGAHPTPASWYNDNAFRNAGIPFFTIPYGANNAGWLQTFQSLATNTGGRMFPADITDDLELQKQFTKALGEALDLETLLDPSGTITSGATRTHTVCVTASTYQLAFEVQWLARNSQAISLTIQTPTGQTITPATAAANPNEVSYHSGQTFAGFVVRGNYLKGNNGAGQWTLRLTGRASTNYLYHVYAQDRIRTSPLFDLVWAGQIARMALSVTEGYARLANVSVQAQYERPSASFNNYLATTAIDPSLVLRAPATVGRRPLSLAERKYYALVNFAKKPFPGERIRGEIRLEPEAAAPGQRGALSPGGRWVAQAQPRAQTAGVFSASFSDSVHDGLYRIRYAVTGTTLLGHCFQREYTISRWADVRLTPELIRNQVRWTVVALNPFFDQELSRVLQQPPRPGYVRRAVQFTPRDAKGNYYGLGRAQDMAFQIKGAEKLGGIQEDLQGSYIQVVEFREGATPSATVSAGGVMGPEAQLEDGGIRWWLWILLLAILLVALILWRVFR
ncbi:MAG: hypothetical protein EHM23_03655 [Acidobacteria bacterium]|nr:MAG: hypothetical protein EHM23_03655 [Acidobacteriota bacterium]